MECWRPAPRQGVYLRNRSVWRTPLSLPTLDSARSGDAAATIEPVYCVQNGESPLTTPGSGGQNSSERGAYGIRERTPAQMPATLRVCGASSNAC